MKENEDYFSFHVSEDGDISVHKIKDINSYLSEVTEKDEYITTLEGNSDPMYWGGAATLLIKGKIVVPKPVEKVTKYEID